MPLMLALNPSGLSAAILSRRSGPIVRATMLCGRLRFRKCFAVKGVRRAGASLEIRFPHGARG
jgi:hypothetical protein